LIKRLNHYNEVYMKIVFDEFLTNNVIPPKNDKVKTKEHNGRIYTYKGKTKDEASNLTRVKAFFECALLTLAGCLIVPCFFEGFRKNFKISANELVSGQETVQHYVLNTQPFTPKENTSTPFDLSDKEHFEKGLEDSKNVKFD